MYTEMIRLPTGHNSFVTKKQGKCENDKHLRNGLSV